VAGTGGADRHLHPAGRDRAGPTADHHDREAIPVPLAGDRRRARVRHRPDGGRGPHRDRARPGAGCVQAREPGEPDRPRCVGIPAPTEHDVGADGMGPSANGSAAPVRRRVGTDSNSTDVMSEERRHDLAASSGRVDLAVRARSGYQARCPVDSHSLIVHPLNMNSLNVSLTSGLNTFPAHTFLYGRRPSLLRPIRNRSSCTVRLNTSSRGERDAVDVTQVPSALVAWMRFRNTVDRGRRSG